MWFNIAGMLSLYNYCSFLSIYRAQAQPIQPNLLYCMSMNSDIIKRATSRVIQWCYHTRSKASTGNLAYRTSFQWTTLVKKGGWTMLQTNESCEFASI